MSRVSEELAAALRELEGFPHPWSVCGGWAIDLWLGEETREHEDVEIGILRADQASVRSCFAGRDLFKSVESGWAPWLEGEWLALPIHQVLVRPPGAGPIEEPWEPIPGEIEFFLNDVEDGVWLCRRDERVTRPAGETTTRTASGVPVVVPEIQLLYKAKHHLDKDEHDFRQAVGTLTPPQRAWLREALEIVHPGDPWLDSLQ